MATGRDVLTYQDYAATPDDGLHYEILDGDLSVTASPVPRHQRVLANLNDILRAHVRVSDLGEVLFAPIAVILADTTIVEPDLVYLASDRATLVSHRGIEGPPTLVVEVLSPSTSLRDCGIKRELYARYGVPWYWIVDPEARIVEVLQLTEGIYHRIARVTGPDAVRLPPFPDLVLAVDTLWPAD